MIENNENQSSDQFDGYCLSNDLVQSLKMYSETNEIS
jgi:hypothetical protein